MRERILIVDDEKNVLHAFRRSLWDMYSIATALSGREALKIIEEEDPFTVIISDYKMPGIDGIELLSQVKEIDPHMVRIMLTGYPHREVALDAMDKGQVFQFLTKPCSSKQLIEAIEIGIQYYHLLFKEKALMEEELERIHHRKGRNENKEENKRLKGVFISLFLSSQKKDPYTALHHLQVSKLATTLARRLPVDEEIVEWIYIAASLHDMGKLYLPLSVLYKPYALTTKEKLLVKTHVEKGYRLLKDEGFSRSVTTMVLEHHERLDGSGYPSGRRGEEIFYGSKILAVADVVEAMGSHRPYRKPLSRESILQELETKKGHLYDEEVVLACQDLFAEGYEFSGIVERDQ